MNLRVKFSDTVANISTTVEEQATATTEISTNVSQGVQRLSEVNDSTAELSKLAEKLAVMMKGFKL